jgi:hypothetical protein
VVSNKRGKYHGLKVRYLPDAIANIFSMNELKKLYPITYGSWNGFYAYTRMSKVFLILT